MCVHDLFNSLAVKTASDRKFIFVWYRSVMYIMIHVNCFSVNLWCHYKTLPFSWCRVLPLLKRVGAPQRVVGRAAGSSCAYTVGVSLNEWTFAKNNSVILANLKCLFLIQHFFWGRILGKSSRQCTEKCSRMSSAAVTWHTVNDPNSCQQGIS